MADIGNLDYRRFWDTIDQVPFHDIGHILRRKEISKHLPAKSNTILTIGSGFGEELIQFRIRNRQAKIYCLDISSKALKKCEEVLGATALIADAQHLPFKDDFFDASCALEVLEHLPNDSQAVKEIHRVLQRGGVVIASTPSPPLTTGWKKHGHLRHYTTKEFRDLFESNGFVFINDLNYYERLRVIYRPVKNLVTFFNSLLNALLKQHREYVERCIYKRIVEPMFLYLARFEENMKPSSISEAKNISAFRKKGAHTN